MKFTAKQQEALTICGAKATHIMFYGGSRSGKTFLHIRNIILRALRAPGSRHCVVRKRFNTVKKSVVFDTFPKVMELCFPGVKCRLDKTDWYAKFENGSEIWFGGLDDKERVEKILGNEYVTIFLNECSEISYDSREVVITRLAQKVSHKRVDGTEQELALRMYYDANPPSKAHWTYKMFHKKENPINKTKWNNPDNYTFFKMNPIDNRENLNEAYLQNLEDLGTRSKKRFLDGEYSDDNPNALFNDTNFDSNRVLNGEVPQLLRVAVAVDPSGSADADNANNDEIGIIAGGLGIDGRIYIQEDNTVKAGPAVWGKVSTDSYDRLEANTIVAEKNFGGEMVKFVIQAAKPNVPVKMVHASRGKAVRAEPVSVLYEKGLVRHVGYFNELEDELIGFSSVGYLGELSPNRADALIWLVSELMPNIMGPQEEEVEIHHNAFNHSESWG